MALSYGYNRKRPRTEVFVDSTALRSANTLSEKPLILIGPADGGVPHKYEEVTNLAQARTFFRSGDLVDAIEIAWNPATESRGAGKIYAMRSDDAKQATLVAEGLTFTSKLYGTDANGIQVEMKEHTGISGAKTKGKDVTVYFVKDRYQNTYQDVGNIFSITHKPDTGAEYASIEVKVDANSKKSTELIIKEGKDEQTAAVLRSFPLGEGLYRDVNVLVEDINNIAHFTATMNNVGGYKNITTDFLDELAATEVTETPALSVTAIGADLENVLATDPYVSATVDRAKTVPATVSIAYLAGGETKPLTSGWDKLFEEIANCGGYYVVPLTSSEGVHAELAHFLRSESTGGNQLRGFVGGGVGETFDKLRSRQAGIRSPRVCLIGDSVERRMMDGRVVKLPAYMYAAQIAGLASGLEIGTPITYKKMNIEKLLVKFDSDQLDQLDASGVVMTSYIRNRDISTFRIVSDPTTYNNVEDVVQNRMSLGETSDFLATDIRMMLDDSFIGTRIRNTSASIIKNAVESFLDKQTGVGGLIVSYNPEDVQVIINGNTAIINVGVQPTRGLDYINVFLNYKDNAIQA
ncbi:tail sheath protein [Bacillus phage BJ4]|nr:tail sheath protein [Bacillus phage BJ4]AOZ62344.1 tail sheath protein [Bacillus phage SBP8a]QLF85869.1 tail sheath protein [Bacillus phage Tomato]UGO46344.1 tail sheath protein [Bacillus phage vB_BanH_Abinadi]